MRSPASSIRRVFAEKRRHFRQGLCAACLLTSPLPALRGQCVPNHAAGAPTQNPLIAQALREIDAQQLEKAERALRSAIEQAPDSAQAHSLLGYVLFRERKPTPSLAEYTAAARNRTPSPDELLIVASDYILLRDYTDAAHWLHYVTEHKPRDSAAWYLLGRTEFNQDHAADAVNAFDRCLAIDPQNTRALYNRGLALEKLGRTAEAMQAYRSSILMQAHSDPKDAQPYLDLGSLLLMQGKPAEAAQMLDQASALAPRNAYVRQQLGKACEAAGDDDRAVKAYEAAISLSPGSEQPHFLLGRLLRRKGDEKRAAEQFEIVRRLVGDQSAKETPNEDFTP